MELPEGYKTLKIERTCQSGFLWAYEFLNYPNVTKNKKALHLIEEHMHKLSNRSSFEKNYVEHQFVAVVMSTLKRVVRGYTLLFSPHDKGATYEVLLIDYGSVVKVHARDLRNLPAYAEVNKLPAQSWRIAIYGVLPVHIHFDFGQSASKTVGESWNGKDIQFISNVVRNSDTIDFQEVKKVGEYRFGYIYLKDPRTKQINTLQKLLVDNGYAVEVENFDKVIPSIVKRIRSSPDHESFPTGDQSDDNNLIETQEESIDNLVIVSTNTAESKLESFQSTKPPSVEPKESKLPTTMSESQSSSSKCTPKPKTGKGRGELMKNLKPRKLPESQPAVMVGRLPMVMDQFDDSTDSIYYDTVSTPISNLNRRESTSSIEFQTPTISRNQSSSSVEIITPKTNPEIETISLITPLNDPSILSYAIRKDHIPTIDLTTPPSQSPISLITPSSQGRDGLDESVSDISQSSSSSRRGRGRGDLLASLSMRSDDSQSMKSATSYESLNEKLSKLKLETSPVLRPCGRGSMLSKLLQDSANEAKQTFSDSTNSSVESVKSSKIDFLNDIVPLKPPPAVAKAKKEIIAEQNELDLSDPYANDILSEDVDYNDKLITKIMVLGNEGVCRFQPRFGINDFDLHKDVKKRASQLRLVDLIRSQRYMIPAMLTRRNVTLIGPSRGGKTVSCLLSLFSLLKDEKFYSALPVGPGPRAIILCPYSSQCEEVERQCNALNKSTYSASSEMPSRREILRLNVAYGCGKEAEKEKLNELTQGYDIVICTPSCLIRLLEIPEMMNFKRLCHLVLDDADTLFSCYNDEIIQILQQAYKCGKKCESGVILPQRVIISREWIPSIKQWIQKDVTEQLGILLIASYSEAAVFSKIQTTLRRIDDEDRKRNDLLNYLHVEQAKKSTVVAFNEVEDMNATYTWLKSKCMRPIIKIGYSLGSADDLVADWKRSSERNEYPILCCTDNSLHDLYIYEANSLIHYNLPPEERGYFTERFSVLLNRLAGPPEYYTPGKMPLNFSKVDTLIYISPDDYIQFPTIIKLMAKLRMNIPKELQTTAEELRHARELQKDNNRFCENYKKFGRCPDEKLCKNRHYFSKKHDQPASDIPKRGFVKMQILQVYSASHYSVRLLQHRFGTKNEWKEIKSNVHPGVLNAKINTYFSDPDKRSMHLCKNIGEVAAIETTTNMFKRVEILELKMDDKYDELKMVKVKFMDDGKIDDVRPSVLVKLSDEFASIPATAVDVFLCNVLPVDKDIEWGDIITNKVRERIQTLQDSEDVLFIGEIQLVSGRDMWINPLQCHKLYDGGKEVIVIISSMCRDLLNKKVADENPEHLPKLLSMYESAGLARPSEIEINSVPESNNNQEIDATPSQSYNSVENIIRESTAEVLDDSGSPGSTVVSSKSEQTLEVYEKPNEPYESEEEWVLEDEPQTPAAPVQNVEETFKREEPHPEEDLYDYDTDNMSSKGLDEEFDCYFGSDVLDNFLEDLHPGFKLMKQSLGMSRSSTSNIVPKIKNKLAIESSTSHVASLINHGSEFPQVNPSMGESEDTTKRIYKPHVEWYQDADFVYMNVSLNVDDHVIRFDSDKIYFRATYNLREYEFDELLYTTIDEFTARSYKSSVVIVVKMEKVIKRNKWPRIFKNKSTSGWIKKSVEHLDDDAELLDESWDQRLNLELALKEPEIPRDFSYISNYNNTSVTIYPEGYEELERDSDEDSDGVGNDCQED